MNFIVFDIEATCWENRNSRQTQEIIEIGAFLLDRYGEVQSSFNRFIKPVLHPLLSPFCKELTTIEQHQINRAATFPDVAEDFQDWAEVFDEEYLFCSWGNFDKKMLIHDCKLHNMEYEWAEPHINIKQQYKEIKRIHRPRGLKKQLPLKALNLRVLTIGGSMMRKTWPKFLPSIWICGGINALPFY